MPTADQLASGQIPDLPIAPEGAPRTGGAHAPDATPQEIKTVEEALAAGPQPPRDPVEHVRELTRDVENPARRPPDIAQQGAEKRLEASQAAQAAMTDAAAAQATLAMMLSASKPPAPNTGTFIIERLSREMGGCSCQSGLHPQNDCEGVPFVMVLRGLESQELDEASEAATRPATEAEVKRGASIAVVDPSQRNREMMVRAMVAPDLRNPELCTKFGPRPIDIVRRLFNPGETNMLGDHIYALSGFDAEDVVKAKKS